MESELHLLQKLVNLSQRFVRVRKRVVYTETWKHDKESQLVCKIAAVVNSVGSG